MQLVKIVSDPDEVADEIDQELVFVPDDADNAEIIRNSNLRAPMVEARIKLIDDSDFDMWRIYTG